MRVTLLHNAGAGEEDHGPRELTALVAEAGHDVTYASLKQEGWDAALEDPGDLVVVAGGDGSVGKVVRKLARRDVRVTLLPLGSANNVARTLGIADDGLVELVRGWDVAEGRPLDVGRVSAPWGETIFVESVGGGIFGEVLARAEEIDAEEADGDEKVRLGLLLMRGVVEAAQAAPWEVEVDGTDLSGNYLAIEVMNIREMGPNVPLAPDADTGDGLLDVVLVGPERREALVGYLDDRLAAVEPKRLELGVHRGDRIRLRPPPETLLHVDDQFWPDDPEARGDGSAVVTPEATLTLLLPRA